MLFEHLGRVDAVTGPSTVYVSIQLGDMTLVRHVKLRNLVPRDAQACRYWMEDNLVGQEVLLLIDRVDRAGHYTADMEIDGHDIAGMLIDEGLAD